MKLISEETLKGILDIAKAASTQLGAQAVDVVNQALNYALFEAILMLIGSLSVYLIYYVISKILVAAENANKIEDTEAGKKSASNIKLVRQLIFIGFTGWALYGLTTPVRMIGKIVISPKVYLLEEGAKILEKLER